MEYEPYDDENYDGVELDEEQRVEMWQLDQFSMQEFDGEQIAQLLEWHVSPHDTYDLLYRDSKRTACTHEQAMRILTPDSVLA